MLSVKQFHIWMDHFISSTAIHVLYLKIYVYKLITLAKLYTLSCSHARALISL